MQALQNFLQALQKIENALQKCAGGGVRKRGAVVAVGNGLFVVSDANAQIQKVRRKALSIRQEVVLLHADYYKAGSPGLSFCELSGIVFGRTPLSLQ